MSLRPWRDQPAVSVERLEQMAAELARQAANITAAEYRFLVLLAEFDAAGGWAHAGARTCAAWLSFACGLSPLAARERVRVARALADLPAISAAFAAGKLSYSKVRAITRVATPDNDEVLAGYGLCATAHQLEKILAGYSRTKRELQRRGAAELFEQRAVTWWTDEAGMVHIAAKLTPDDGALVIAQLQRLAESGGQDHPAPPAPGAGPYPIEQAERGRGDAPITTPHFAASPPAAARRADALRIMAETAAAHGPAAAIGGETHLVIVHTHHDELTDPDIATAGDRAHAHVPAGTPGNVPAGTPHADHSARTPAGGSDRARPLAGADVSEAYDGADPDVPAGTPTDPAAYVGTHIDGVGRIAPDSARRLACDATIAVLIEDAHGRPLGISRQSSKVPRWLRRALSRRDRGGCRFPSCTATRYVDAHHIVHWADGGPTDLDNLILLCRFHHRLVHEVGYTITLHDDTTFTFHRPDGTDVPNLPPIRGGDPNTIHAENTAAGLTITEYTAIPTWDGTTPDYSQAISDLHDATNTPAT